jgi:phage tail sheath gpL-like
VTANVANIIRGTWFNAIVAGSDDVANVAYIKGLLDDRWQATVQQTGVMFFSLNGCVVDGDPDVYYGTASLDALKTRGNALDSQVVVLPSLPETPTPGFEVAAAVLGCIAPKALNDPAQPLSNWAVAGIVAPRETDREDLEGNNLLLKAGCALLTCGNDGTVYLKRMVTTYKTNPAGAKDTSYQQLEKVFTLSFLRWDWNNYLAGRYPHAKLADDGTDFGPGQVIMTPKLGEAELLGRYEYWISKGLVQDYATFKANLVVARDPDDDTALQFLIPADLIDQFFIGKSKIQFK